MPKRQAVLKLHYMSIFIFSAGLVVLVLIGGFFAWRLARAYRQFTVKMNLTSATLLADLPSVSVCIPARNETHAMTECLERVIASNYPKIEIIVLDDSSVDDTSVLIKSFAHSGVRFVEGSPLPDGWLGKNHALEGLLKEASGRYVFFMDVDTKISPFTISQLVAYAASEDATMVSVLPRRNDGWRMSVIWTTLRYFWEIIFHTPAKPVAASNAWMVHRRTLRDEIGGFSDFKLDVQPEQSIAQRIARLGRYRFLIGSPDLGVSYEKKWSSQVETSIRLLLPRVGGHIYQGLLAVFGLALLNAPTAFIVLSILSGWWSMAITAFVVGMVFVVIYASFTYRTWSRGWWLGGILWPLLVFQEMILMCLSIIRYATGSVTWKGRPVVSSIKQA